jgi:futalosine hydrolase
MSRPSVPTEPGLVIFLIPTAREYAAVARALRVSGEAAPWTLAPGGSNIALAMSGIGKSNAAGAAGALLGRLDRPRALVCLGVAGALPGGPAGIGEVILASDSRFGDEGVQTDEGFLTCEELGFPIGPPRGAVAIDPELAAVLAPLADHQGVIAAVSTCAGTDDLARRRRDGAIAEAMEGAAAGLVAWRLGVPFAELRVISNTTGARERQIWDLDRALGRLAEVGALVAQRLG